MSQTSVSESMSAAFDGMIADGRLNKDVRAYVNEEASAAIAFGTCVAQGATYDDGMLKLAAITDDLIGILVYSADYDPTIQLSSGALRPKQRGSVMKRGSLWVPVETAVNPGSNVLVRAVVAGSEVAGAFRATADASDLIDISAFAQFTSRTSGSGRARLEFDFLMRSA